MFRKKNKSKCYMVNVDPKEKLLKCVAENDLDEIRNIIVKNPDIINKFYHRAYLKANLYLYDLEYPFFDCTILVAALTFMASTTSVKVIEILIELNATLYYDYEEWNEFGLDAIHFAVLGGNPQLLERIINHIDPEKINSTTKFGLTALHFLIDNRNLRGSNFIECIKVLLENKININQTDYENVSAIYSAASQNYTEVIEILIKCKNINLDIVTVNNNTARDLLKKMDIDIRHISICIPTDREQLLHNLKLKQESEFVRLASIIGIDNQDDINEETYLQYACRNNLLKVVEYLLSQNVDVNKISKLNAQSPIHIAADKGYHKLFKLLIENHSTIVESSILLEILKKIYRYQSDDINYYLCYKYLMMNRKDIDVNFKNEFGDYPLNCSTDWYDTELTLFLLNAKASLGNRNNDGHLTIKSVDYETLNNHLDNCIEESWGIKFDYVTLLPTSEMVEEDSNMKKLREDAEQPLNNKVKIFLETEVVLYMSSSPELKSLLKHPVITSFLDIKWHRIRWLFYTNVLFYLIFCLALVLHSILSFNSANGQNFITYVFLIIMLILLIIRELFQFFIAPKKYLQYFENCFEVVLIIIVIWLLSIRIPFDKTRNQLCASAILLAAFDLLYLLGNHPLLSTKIVMLRRVSLTFFNFFISYLILLIAFALSFHILFNDTGSSSLSLGSNNTETSQEDNNSFFVNPFVSIFKTLIMFTGEFESGNLNFEQYPVTSHLIFLIFVTTIAVILLNLLNGLAVSDTQNIMNEAELHGHIARAQFISYVESLIITSLVTSDFIYRCYNLVSCQNRYKNFLVLKTFAKKISLFPIGMDNSPLYIINEKAYFEDINSVLKSQSFSLDKKCIQNAKTIIHEKREKEKYNTQKVREEEQNKEKEEEKNHSKEKEEQEKLRIDNLNNKINEIINVLQKEREEHNREKEEEKKYRNKKEEQEKLRIDNLNNKINEIINVLQKEREEHNREKEEEKKYRNEKEEQEKLRIDNLNNKINKIANILQKERTKKRKKRRKPAKKRKNKRN